MHSMLICSDVSGPDDFEQSAKADVVGDWEPNAEARAPVAVSTACWETLWTTAAGTGPALAMPACISSSVS